MRRLKPLTLFIAFVMAVGVFSGCSNITKGKKFVEVYETTGTKSKLLSRQTDLEYKKADPLSSNVTVEIDENERYQDFLGLGASMTHSSAHLLMQLTQNERTVLLKEFFGENGARFNYVRVPIGASDYTEAQQFFTCNDTENNAEDLSLSGFSVDNDFKLISVLKEVVAINPDIRLIAVPWSAPAWMKSNRSLFGGTLSPQYNDIYAQYLVKFVKIYASRGINFNYISILNEPFISNIEYPHMQMGGTQSAEIIKLLGGKLKSEKLNISVMAYEHNYSAASSAASAELFIDEVLDNKQAKKYVSGVAFHGYDNLGFADFAPGLEYVQDNYKNTETYITEITEHSGSVDFASNISYGMKNVLINPINHNLNAALFWNFVLTSDGKPVKGNEAVCFGLISLDKAENGEFTYSKNAAYYAMAHISRFAYQVGKKTPRRVLATSSNDSKIIATAFVRGDKRLVVVAHNTNDSTYEDVDFVIEGRSVTYRIMPQSVVTLVFGNDTKDSQKYTAFEIENVEIVQQTATQFDFFVTLEGTGHSDAEFYFTKTDFVASDCEPIAATLSDGRYALSIDASAGDYFLTVKTDGRTGVLPVTIPKMSPFVTLVGSGASSYVKLDFSIDGATSWSSFIDPKGKNVYKSASKAFDETAVAIRTGVNITEESINDTAYSEEMPYYFVVLSGKNGRLKFISYAIVPPWVLYDSIRAELKNGDSGAILEVSVELATENPDGQFFLLIRSGSEQYQTSAIVQAGGLLLFKFSLSTLTKADTWYDILIEEALTGQQANLSDSDKTGVLSLTEGIRRYEFKEWNGDLKINFSAA